MQDTEASTGAGRVTAVVVTYQRLPQLQRTLERLLAARPEHLHAVVVVDNASTDGTAEWLAEYADPRLIVQTLPRNMGGAGGFAAGMRFARETLDPDWILVMDDDARPQPGTLARFHEADRSSRDAWAGAVYYPSGTLCEMNRPTLNPFWRPKAFLGAALSGRRGFHVSDEDFAASTTKSIDAASFVGLFVSRRAMELAGYPDPALFLYGDDALYTLGIRKAGGLIEFDPRLEFEHDCESSLPNQKIYSPVWRAYYHHRNILFVYRRAAGIFFWPAVLPIILKWRLSEKQYGGEAPVYRALLKRAIHDGLRRDTSASLSDIKAQVKKFR